MDLLKYHLICYLNLNNHIEQLDTYDDRGIYRVHIILMILKKSIVCSLSIREVLIDVYR